MRGIGFGADDFLVMITPISTIRAKALPRVAMSQVNRSAGFQFSWNEGLLTGIDGFEVRNISLSMPEGG